MVLEIGDIITHIKPPSGPNAQHGRVLKVEKMGEEAIIHYLLQNGQIDFDTEGALRKVDKTCENFFAIGIEVKINVNSPKANSDMDNQIGKIVSRFRGGTYRVVFENREMFNFKEIDLTPIRPYGTLDDLKEVAEKYKYLTAPAKINEIQASAVPSAISSKETGFRFKKGDIVRIKDTTNLKKRTPNRLNHLGKIIKVPIHPNTWFKVEFENKEVDGFRSYSLEFVKHGNEIKTRSKVKEQNFTLFKEEDGTNMRIKITYGSHLNKEGVMIGYAPGYIVIEVAEVNDKGEKVLETIHKRRDHIEALNESSRAYLSRVRSVSDKNKNKKGTRGGNRRGRKRGGRVTKPRATVTNPLVTKLLRKKVAVLDTGLVGKVVYYDSKKDTFTVRLNENNPHNLKQLELAQNNLDISCKLKVKHDQIMLWEEYKVANGIQEEKELIQGSNGVNQGKYKRKLGEDLPLKEKAQPDNLLSQLQKALKFRSNGVHQHIKYYIERELKVMPYRPDLSKILRKYNHEVKSDLSVFERDTAFVDPQLIHSYLPKGNEIVITLRNTPVSSILSQDFEVEEKPERKDRGKYPLFYNPPLCVYCGMEKFAKNGQCWNKICSSSPVFNEKTETKEEELVDAYNYNKRFKVNNVLSEYLGKKVKEVSLEKKENEQKRVKRNIFGDDVGYFGVGWNVKLPILNQKREQLSFDAALKKDESFKAGCFESSWNKWVNTV